MNLPFYGVLRFSSVLPCSLIYIGSIRNEQFYRLHMTCMNIYAGFNNFIVNFPELNYLMKQHSNIPILISLLVYYAARSQFIEPLCAWRTPLTTSLWMRAHGNIFQYGYFLIPLISECLAALESGICNVILIVFFIHLIELVQCSNFNMK